MIEQLQIEDYAAEGKSLARKEGKVIFVEKTVPGDVVDVKVNRSKKDWAEGQAILFHKLSEARIEPFCQHFDVCGGCQWQMLPYEKQLAFKQRQVMDHLKRIGKLELPEPIPILGCAETRRYRNKLEYTFSAKQFIPENVFNEMARNNEDITEKFYRPVAGFFAKGKFDKVVEILQCHLQPEPTNAIRNEIADFTRQNNLPFYDFRKHEGWLRNVVVRNSILGEWMVNVVFKFEDEKNRVALLNLILEKYPQITTLLYTINPKRNDSLFDLEPQVFSGSGFIVEKLENFSFKISPNSFFQTNTIQAENLYKITRDFAGLDGTQVVYDLYCGTGSIGIFLSRQAKQIIGIEINAASVKDAETNAGLNHLNNTRFFAGDVTDVCDDNFFKLNGRPDVIITDPPRAGMHEKLVKKLLEIEAPVIVYVSCNPATQARDLSLLCERYWVEKIQAVDMFPHTHHIENVVKLKLKDV